MKQSKNSRHVIEIALIALICIFVLWLSANMVISQTKDTMRDELSHVEKRLEKVYELYDTSNSNQKRVQKHLARLGAYYLKMTDDPLSKKTVDRLRDILDIKDVYILDEDGRILQSSDKNAEDTLSAEMRKDLSRVSENNPYCEVLNDTAESAGDGESDVYYSYYIDSGHTVVLREDYIDYGLSLTTGNGIYDVIKRSRFGKNGFFFLLSPEGKMSFSTFNADSFNGSDKIDVPAKGFRDGYSGIFSRNGHNYFFTVEKLKNTEVLLACAMPLRELAVTLAVICIASVVVVFATLLFMYLYAYIKVLEASKKRNRKAAFKSFRNRLTVLTLLCIIMSSGIIVYVHTLYVYASSLSSNVIKAEELQDAIAPLDEIQELGSDHYKKTVKAFTMAAASLISRDPDLYERKNLKQLAETLCADHILVYDESGKVIASDQNYTGLTLSDDPDDMSNDFQWVIRGEPYLIQEKADSEYLNKSYLFSGAPLRDEDGDVFGLVQLAIPPSFREDMVIMTSIDSLLSSFYDGGNAIPFAIDIDNHKVHSAYEPFDGLKAEELGFTENQLKDEYTGFFNLQNQTLLGGCKTSGNHWAIMASFTTGYPLQGFRGSLPMILTIIVLVLLFLAFLLFRMKQNGGLITADGMNLFNDKKISEARAETHIIRLIGDASVIGAALVSFTVFFGPALFQKETPGYYNFAYPWDKGFNIFTVTSCLTIICIVDFTMSLILKFLSLLTSLLSSRQQTILLLLISFLRYFGWIGAIYYCLTLLGIPTISLLASAGALTAIFSIGAQNIVADILAGLFIIFEGSFKVGDMITVDDWHGQVQEIGIRNTTIRDLINNDVKILNNSTIKRVVNNSVYPSFCAMKIGIPYNMDLKELEEIIEKELPVMQGDLEDRIEAFRYLGVDEFADSSVIVKFEVACRNQDYNKVKRALNREIKLMFDRNGINVPFPQIVLHEESTEKSTD